MRIDVKKFLFFGVSVDQALFFKRAQEIGIVHFIDPKQNGRREVPQAVEGVIRAIKIVRGLPVLDQEETDNEELYERILAIQDTIEGLSEEERVLKLEIARVKIFGDFSLNDVTHIERARKLQFYSGKKGSYQELPAELFYVGEDQGLDYFFGIHKEPRSYPKLVEMQIDRPVGELQTSLDATLHAIHIASQELKTYAKYNLFLHELLRKRVNVHNLVKTKQFAEKNLEGELFVIQGWVPVNKVDLLKTLDVYVEEIAIEPYDVIPTFLENEGAARMGEDLVNIYDTPAHTDKDPSLWVLSAFALFFAFIVGDGGYGSVYLGIALYIRYKYPDLKEGSKRALNLFTLLCFACMAWGILTTSFFGMEVAIDNPIRRVSLVQWLVEKKTAYHIQARDATYEIWVKKFPALTSVQDPYLFLKGASTDLLKKFSDNIVLELSLFIGVVHVILSYARYLGRNWKGIGWILFLIGGYLYFPLYLGAPSLLNYVGGINLQAGGEAGKQLMAVGIALAIILAVVKDKLFGLLESMTIIQIFADVLSYLRLYALGLSGSMVSSTINEMAASLPFVFGVMLVILAHGVNILLGTMSGVIHGLRLNFLEWYHYSFEGGGKPFKPLELIK